MEELKDFWRRNREAAQRLGIHEDPEALEKYEVLHVWQVLSECTAKGTTHPMPGLLRIMAAENRGFSDFSARELLRHKVEEWCHDNRIVVGLSDSNGISSMLLMLIIARANRGQLPKLHKIGPKSLGAVEQCFADFSAAYREK